MLIKIYHNNANNIQYAYPARQRNLLSFALVSEYHMTAF